MDHKPPTAVIESAHSEQTLPFDDTTDFDNADRGFIAALSPCVIKAADGRVVWDNDVYSFLGGPAPTSVHPSLWRQSTLAAKQGLYEVVPGIYQVRGLDISNITFVEGDTGIIVIDPLVSTEVAAAALGLYRTHRGGERPVRRGDLHPQSRRPFRRRAGRHLGSRRGFRRGDGIGARRFHRPCRPGERLRGAGDDAPRDLHVWLAAGTRTAGAGGLRARPDPVDRRGGHHRPDRRYPGNRGDAHHRRRADRVPDGAGHRGTCRDAFLFPALSAHCAWPRTPLTTCTTC